MKKILIILGFIGLISCEQNADPDIYQSESLTYFTESTSANYFVAPGQSEYRIQVGVTDASDVDREFTVSVNEEETTASPNAYSLENTFTIEAGEYIGEVVVNGNFDNVVDGESIVIDLVEINGSSIADFDNQFELTFFRFCEYSQASLVGEWTLNSEFWDTSYTVNIVAGEDEFTYIAQDLYGPTGFPNTQDIIINVVQIDDTTFELNVEKQGAFNATFAVNYGLLSIEGGGTLDTCGEMNMILEFTVAAGTFGEYNEVLTKN
ncbi:hypothetical protein [Psychroflexus sediminis]|uniref:Calx-beta domain-containing protein n=1 Tax=Psychroflexus sediminis TaxID=470826 RepID=A0A1G7U336_9FLAO|nr:hypothetical protein [Psychroflexus sediminis]SDG41804.1 hypothetical protein SAMN04488027_101214 [Psychroflexus sediminis]